MPDESPLREKARAVIRTGKLPGRRLYGILGGPGVGALCAICDQPLGHDEQELEIQFENDGGALELDKFHVHVQCFSAWEFERKPI